MRPRAPHCLLKYFFSISVARGRIKVRSHYLRKILIQFTLFSSSLLSALFSPLCCLLFSSVRKPLPRNVSLTSID